MFVKVVRMLWLPVGAGDRTVPQTAIHMLLPSDVGTQKVERGGKEGGERKG